jgi:GWxTD domain-containing protein
LPDAATRQTLARLALILPPDLATRAEADPIPATLGSELWAWWALQDPLPATPINERVVEHNLRIASALAAFEADTPTGFDARGEVFVRFGAPARRRSIDVKDDLFIARAIRDDPSVRRTDFPRNEAWYYPALGPNVYFLFVEKQGGYQQGRTVDLLPRSLLAGGMNRETESRARLLGQALRWIYKDLYEFSADIRQRLITLDATVGGDGAAFSGNTAFALQPEVQRARQADEVEQRYRDETLPPAATRIRGNPFGLVYRLARFRDGGPGSETFSLWAGWTLARAPLVVAADSLRELGVELETFLLDAHTVRYEAGHQRDTSTTRRYLLELDGAYTTPLWTTVSGVGRGGHAALEWDLIPSTSAGAALPPGVVSAAVAWADSIGEDGGSPGVDLSDLLPVDPDAALALDIVDRLGDMPPPYPFATVRPGQPVAVYYEIYGSEPGVEVEVEARAVAIQRGRILRGPRDFATATASRFTLSDVRSPEFVVLDVLESDEADEIRIEVAVTRADTGERVTRSVSFGVVR